MSQSAKMKQMMDRGIAKGMSLSRIEKDADFVKARREHESAINTQKLSWSAAQWLGGGNAGAFKSSAERENAMAIRATDSNGKSVLLYDLSPEFRKAVQTKMELSSDQICGIQAAPSPLTPEAMMSAAEENLYHKTREHLFDVAAGKDQVAAAKAQLEILQLGTDPQWAPMRERFERTEAETRPYETWLKSQPGGVRVEVGGGTPKERQDYADEQNLRNSLGVKHGEETPNMSKGDLLV